MKIFKIEGIILKVIDFRDYDQIMTVLTPEKGIVKWIFKKRPSARGGSLVKISPLTKAEFVYTETKGDIWKCREISILNHHFKLRENYAWLETAGRLINWILASQTEQKSSEHLYCLLSAFLEKIPIMTDLRSLEINYIIHLLRHEGLINIDLHCTVCQKPLRNLYMSQGDHFCELHAPLGALSFDEEETLAWMQIAACLTFSELKSIFIPKNLLQKVEVLFKNLIHY